MQLGGYVDQTQISSVTVGGGRGRREVTHFAIKKFSCELKILTSFLFFICLLPFSFLSLDCTTLQQGSSNPSYK